MKKDTTRDAKAVAKSERPRGIAKWKKCGATYLEYALLLALVGIVGAVGVQKYGKAIFNFFAAMAQKTAEVTPDTKK